MQERIIFAPGVSSTELLRTLARKGINTFGLRIMNGTQLAQTALMRSGVAADYAFLSGFDRAYYYQNEFGVGTEPEAPTGKLFETLDSLRLLIPENESEIIRERLPQGKFREKNEKLLELYESYMRYCDCPYDDPGNWNDVFVEGVDHVRWKDAISVMRLALEKAEPLKAQIIALKEFPLSPLEKHLAETLAGDGVRKLTMAELFGREKSAPKIDSVTAAYGSSNEVEDIIGRIYEQKIPLDRCTIAVADPAVYSQLFYEYAVRYNIPVTFGCGIPAANSNPAKILKLHTEWKTHGCGGVDALRFERPEEIAFDEDSGSKKTFAHMLQYIFEHPEIQKNGTGKVGEERREIIASIPEYLEILRGRWQDNIKEVLVFFRKAKKIQLENNPDDFFMYRFGEHVPAKTGTTGKVNYYFLDLTGEKSPAAMLRELQHAITLDFMDSFVREAADSLRNTGSLSYFDCLLYLRDMLRSDAEKGGLLAQHISKRHRYYLIDEFQDTNPLQAEIFFYLTAKEPRTDWRECVPRPGSLFIVGDPKQSIYRFRNADVASYLRIREMFKGEVGRTISLTRNFRSTKELCGWFDCTFTQIMNADSDTQCRYNPIPVDDSEPESAGTLHGVYRYDSGDSSDPDYLVSMVKWIVGNDNHTVRDRNGEVRRVRFGDIMVITCKKLVSATT